MEALHVLGVEGGRHRLHLAELVGHLVEVRSLQHLGVAILPRSTNGTIERLGLLALPLPEHCEPRRFGLIWSRVSPRLALIQAFRDIAIMEYAKAPGTGNAPPQ